MSQFPSQPETAPPGARVVVVALVLALLAVVLTNLYIEYVRRSGSKDTITVYLLTRSLRPGETLREQDVKAVAVPAGFKDSFEQMHALTPEDLSIRLNHKRDPVHRAAAQGELLTFSLFQGSALSDDDRHIKVGYRQISVQVNSRTLPGALREGMYVDLLAPYNLGGGIEVLPVLEHVKVIALGTRTIYDSSEDGRVPRSFQTITLELEAPIAMQFTALQRLAVGDFELHLRNPSDSSTPHIPDGGVNPRLLALLNKR